MSSIDRSRWSHATLVFVALLLVVGGCTRDATQPEPSGRASDLSSTPNAPSAPPVEVCDHQAPGPTQPPEGAITVDPDVVGDLANQTAAHPAGTTFWLATGRHTLTKEEFAQVIPKDGNVYVGAPDAILDGQGVNRFAFTTQAKGVTIRHLTVQGFVAPNDQGVVNHDSGDDWVIEDNTIQRNQGAGLMAGARQVVRRNCLRENGQYGMNAYQAGDGITALVVESNEIVGNNTGDWETRVPGCGCTGGVKFWAVRGADVRSNWIHGNHGAGLWADTNNTDFLIEGNLIESNDAEAIFYETSYNLTMRFNMLRNNTWVKGRQFRARNDTFPVAAVYVSESGGAPDLGGRTDRIDIERNVLENNWSGVTAWENADRFCNSPANTSGRYCPLGGGTLSQCVQPAISKPPLYDTCRWKTQRVDVHDNTFSFDPEALGCPSGPVGTMALLSNYGTFPKWSPYKGDVIQEAITFRNGNTWRNNSYRGPWRFMPHDVGRVMQPADWQASPYGQDTGSSFVDQGSDRC